MAQSSFPFENIDTTEAQYSALFANLQDTGVKGVPGDGNLLVTGDSSGMQVRVAAGDAFIRGFYYQNSIQATVTLAAAPTTGQSRIDSIVLTLDTVANSILLAVVQGTAATTGAQVAPTLTQSTTGIYQLLLAQVLVTGGASVITAGNVTDSRTFMGTRFQYWTTATRPTAPTFGTTGFNQTLGYHEYWDSTVSAWKQLGGGDLSGTFLLMGA
jgi:hypothetical protein